MNRLQRHSFKSFLESLFRRWQVALRWLGRRRGSILRFMLCWWVGILALATDEANQVDFRLNLRGQQGVSSKIVIIQLKQNDFSKIFDFRTNTILNVNELADITDSFYWDKKTWSRFLSTLLSYEPRAVLVTLYFGNNIGSEVLNSQENLLFKDKKIFWATSVNNMERLSLPLMTLPDRSNIGTHEIHRDEDGVVRRVYTSTEEIPSLVERALGQRLPEFSSSQLINFRGQNVFPTYTLSDVLEDASLREYLRNKIIVVGAEGSSETVFQTPLGAMSKAEVTAQVADNILNSRWIKKWPRLIYVIYILLILIFTLLIMNRYPQNVSVVILFGLGILLMTLSAWSFDSHNLWLPAVSPSLVMAMTWVIFVGYQAMQIEQAHFHLQQEKKYLEELEQLKNNFVSLISHDLKTPIAKIQAVVDRLLSQLVSHQSQVAISPPPPNIATTTLASAIPSPASDEQNLRVDLLSLRKYSEELNRYIQSILKVLRVESRDFKLNKEVGDLNEVIVEAIQMLRPLAAAKSIRLDTQLEPLFSQEFDTTLMKEVLINLVENAIKYTPPEGLVLISSHESEDHVHVKVIDNGEGIAKEDLANVWGKFVRGKGQDHRSKGTGLGLYLVKYFIELHGGSVELTSELKHGTTVHFTLPLTPPLSSAEDELLT